MLSFSALKKLFELSSSFHRSPVERGRCKFTRRFFFFFFSMCKHCSPLSTSAPVYTFEKQFFPLLFLYLIESVKRVGVKSEKGGIAPRDVSRKKERKEALQCKTFLLFSFSSCPFYLCPKNFLGTTVAARREGQQARPPPSLFFYPKTFLFSLPIARNSRSRQRNKYTRLQRSSSGVVLRVVCPHVYVVRPHILYMYQQEWKGGRRRSRKCHG